MDQKPKMKIGDTVIILSTHGCVHWRGIRCTLARWVPIDKCLVLFPNGEIHCVDIPDLGAVS